MSITEGTQPAAVTTTSAWTGAGLTTASFTPESGALLLALVSADGVPTGTTTAAISDSLSGTWTLLGRENVADGTVGGTCEVWCRDSPGTALTVTVIGSANASNGAQFMVRTLIGAKVAAQQTGAKGGFESGSGAAIQVSVAAGTGNKIYGAAFNWTNNTAMSPVANTSVINAFSDATNGDSWEIFKSSGDTAGTATYGYSTSTQGQIEAVEILAATPASTAPKYNPGQTLRAKKKRQSQKLPPETSPAAQAPAAPALPPFIAPTNHFRFPVRRAPAMPALRFPHYNTGATGTATGVAHTANQTLTIPSGVLVGDQMLVSIGVFTFTPTNPDFTISSAAGHTWTPLAPGLVNSGAAGGLNMFSRIWARTATAGDPGDVLTLAFTGTPGSTDQFWWAYSVNAWTGITGIDVVATPIFGDVASSASPAMPTTVTTKDSDWLVNIGPIAVDGSGTITAPPAGETMRANPGTAGINCAVSDGNASAGNSGTSIGGGTFTISSTTSWWNGWTIGLQTAPFVAAALVVAPTTVPHKTLRRRPLVASSVVPGATVTPPVTPSPAYEQLRWRFRPTKRLVMAPRPVGGISQPLPAPSAPVRFWTRRRRTVVAQYALRAPSGAPPVTVTRRRSPRKYSPVAAATTPPPVAPAVPAPIGPLPRRLRWLPRHPRVASNVPAPTNTPGAAFPAPAPAQWRVWFKRTQRGRSVIVPSGGKPQPIPVLPLQFRRPPRMAQRGRSVVVPFKAPPALPSQFRRPPPRPRSRPINPQTPPAPPKPAVFGPPAYWLKRLLRWRPWLRGPAAVPPLPQQGLPIPPVLSSEVAVINTLGAEAQVINTLSSEVRKL